MRPKIDIDAEKFDDYALEQLAIKSKPYAEFVAAIKEARKACGNAGLDCSFDENGNAEFSSFQTAKTARHTREDAAATLLLQVGLMVRLDRNRNYMWAIIALLLYIASQLK